MDWAIPLTIYILLPLAGLAVFIGLCRRMQRAQIPSPPYFSYLVLFASFGGALQVALTELFWRWSGLASLGTVFLLGIAPVLNAGIAIRSWRGRKRSLFHRGAFIAGAIYSGLTLPLLIIELVRLGRVLAS